jgi:hypothetical protein
MSLHNPNVTTDTPMPKAKRQQLHPFQDEEMPSKKGRDTCRMKELIKGEKQRKS